MPGRMRGRRERRPGPGSCAAVEPPAGRRRTSRGPARCPGRWPAAAAHEKYINRGRRGACHMERREFDVRPPARPILWDDVRHEFHSGLLKACGLTLATLCHENHGRRHVWVHVRHGKITAVVVFDDWQDHLHIEVITNNFALPRGLLRAERPGTSLYSAVERAARRAGIRRITLDSLPGRVGYWSMLGFRATGPSNDEDPFALLPMEKYL